MDARFAARVPHPRGPVSAVIGDLGTYPRWLSIVQAAEPVDVDRWQVRIGARVGPFSRAKRLLMTRTAVSDDQVRFERDERDGRHHPAWVLDVRLADADGGAATTVRLDLHYGGAPGLPLLDALLVGEARRAATRLGEVVAEQAD